MSMCACACCCRTPMGVVGTWHHPSPPPTYGVEEHLFEDVLARQPGGSRRSQRAGRQAGRRGGRQAGRRGPSWGSGTGVQCPGPQRHGTGGMRPAAGRRFKGTSSRESAAIRCRRCHGRGPMAMLRLPVRPPQPPSPAGRPPLPTCRSRCSTPSRGRHRRPGSGGGRPPGRSRWAGTGRRPRGRGT